jgi:hypothetical protein
VKLDWMMLANYAEIRDGLIYIMGGTWDTVNVGAPLEPPPGAPPGAQIPFAVVQGTLVARLLFHVTETGKDHTFEITVIDEDGGEVAKIEGGMRPEKTPGLPVGWEQGFPIVLPLTGLGLPKAGLYRISLQVNGSHVGDHSFRVLKVY